MNSILIQLDGHFELQCQDEQDADRVGKALAMLIVAYGGKEEMELPKTRSDSF